MKKLLFAIMLFATIKASSQQLLIRNETPKLSAYLKAGSDTLEIFGNAIKFIKVDGKVFKIVRSVEIKEAALLHGVLQFNKIQTFPTTTRDMSTVLYQQDSVKKHKPLKP